MWRKKIGFGSIFIAVIFLFSVASPAIATTTKNSEGTACKKVGQTVKVNSKSLVCTKTSLGKIYISTLAEVGNPKQEIKNLKKMLIQLQNIDVNYLQVRVNEKDSILSDISNAYNIYLESKSTLGVKKRELRAYEKYVPKLPNEIKKARNVRSNFSKTVDSAQKNYVDYLRQLNAISYENSIAENAIMSQTACVIVQMFEPWHNCSPYNPYYDIVRSKYRSLEAQTNFAKSQYDRQLSQAAAYDKVINDLIAEQANSNQKLKALGSEIKQIEKSIAKYEKTSSQNKFRINRVERISANLNVVLDDRARLITEIETYLLDPPKKVHKQSKNLIKESGNLIAVLRVAQKDLM